MHIHKRAMGSVLIILGTSIGAGMLALPVVTAQENIQTSFALLFFSWLLMTLGALALLEVNLWLPPESHLVSMAEKNFGVTGKIFTWVLYLSLLYSLLCAYLSGLGDVLHGVLLYFHWQTPLWLTTCLSLLLLVPIIYRGIHSVDLVNRALMSIKLLGYLLVVGFISMHIHVAPLLTGRYHLDNSVIMVMLTSFGYAAIIPSLRGYLNNEERLLKKVVLVGSLLPLFIYAVWIVVIQGLIQREGPGSLASMLGASHTNTLLMHTIGAMLQNPWIEAISGLFISICAVTSFLGVSVSLVDFMADGLRINKRGRKGLWVYALTFLPPLVIVLLVPGLFIHALKGAGVCCLLLLIVLPLLMLYQGRYRLHLQARSIFPGGRVLIILTLLMTGYLLVAPLL